MKYIFSEKIKNTVFRLQKTKIDPKAHLSVEMACWFFVGQNIDKFFLENKIVPMKKWMIFLVKKW